MGTEPSNQEILNEVIDVKVIVKDHGKRIGVLEADKIAKDAVENYRRGNTSQPPVKPNGTFNWARVIELLVQALISALVIIGTLVGTGAVNG